eukprot:3748692-Prymnesium_polylepis.1
MPAAHGTQESGPQPQQSQFGDSRSSSNWALNVAPESDGGAGGRLEARLRAPAQLARAGRAESCVALETARPGTRPD